MAGIHFLENLVLFMFSTMNLIDNQSPSIETQVKLNYTGIKSLRCHQCRINNTRVFQEGAPLNFLIKLDGAKLVIHEVSRNTGIFLVGTLFYKKQISMVSIVILIYSVLATQHMVGHWQGENVKMVRHPCGNSGGLWPSYLCGVLYAVSISVRLWRSCYY